MSSIWHVPLGNWVSLTSLWVILACFLPILVILCRTQQRVQPKGCRRLGLPEGWSNLDDEFDPKYNKGVFSTEKDSPWRVKALFTFPLKSCGGIELQASDVVQTGLKFDRQFVFAEYGTEGWNCRTLRNAGYERLALIYPEIWVPDPSATDYDPSLPEVQSMGIMVISYPRLLPSGPKKIFFKIGTALGIYSKRHTFQVPLAPPKHSNFPLTPVKIWKDKPLAFDYGTLLPASLHTYLGFDAATSPLTLFCASPHYTREIYRNAPRKDSIGFQPITGFADAYPIHLLSLSSHRDVATKCAYAIPRLSIRRFRANIIIQGPAPFEEDHWTRIAIGGVEIHAACRTVRCRLPNVDPETGVRHAAEPDRTLKAYRKIDDGDRTNACLGMQLVPAVREFRVYVGNEVKVLETGVHKYIKMLAPGEQVEGT